MTAPRTPADTSVERSKILSAYETAWRYWRSFLAEQQDALQRRSAEAGTFNDTMGLPLTASSAPVKANLPGDVRQELMRVLELRRQETQAAAEEDARQRGDPVPDRDTIFASVLDHIAQELAGATHPRGLAMVWSEGRLQEFNHHRVLGQATNADYQAQLGGDQAKKRRALILMGGGLLAIGLVFAILVVTNLGTGTSTTTTTVRAAHVNGEAVPLWDVTQLGVGTHQYSVPFARTGYPLLVCAPPTSKAAITPGATVVLTGTAGVRTYQVQPTGGTTSDLVISDCTQRPPATLGRASLMGARTSTALDPSHLLAVAVAGPDVDPQSIPADRMRVTLTVDASAGKDGTLVLADGSRIAPAASTTISTGLTLTYLVPLATASQPAGWEVSTSTSLPAVLALTLPAPQSRAQMLRDALDVQAGTVTVTRQNGAVLATVPLRVQNTTSQPLTLRASDLIALQGTSVVESATWNPPTIRAGQTVTTEVRITVHMQAQPLELSLAGWHGRLHWQL